MDGYIGAGLWSSRYTDRGVGVREVSVLSEGGACQRQ